MVGSSFNADGRDHCIIGEALARCIDVVVDHRSATPRNSAQALQTGLLPDPPRRLCRRETNNSGVKWCQTRVAKTGK
jgi:hypothetical protein